MEGKWEGGGDGEESKVEVEWTGRQKGKWRRWRSGEGEWEGRRE